MRKDPIRSQGERSRSNAHDAGLLILNGRPGNVLLPFRETTCSPFFAFRGLKIRFMPSHEPHCPIVLFKVNVQRHSKRPNSLPGWKDKGQGQTRTTQAFEMGVVETYFCGFVKRPVARFLHFGGLKILFMPSHEPQCPIVYFKVKFQSHAKRPNSWPGWKVKVKRERHRPPNFEWA